MVKVDVIYHQEGETWWADSANLPGFVAGGNTLDEVRALVRDGVPFYLDTTDEVDIREAREGCDRLIIVTIA